MESKKSKSKKRAEKPQKEASEAKVEMKKQKKASEKVSKMAWMRNRLKADRRLRPEYMAALECYLQECGLGDMEEIEKYEKAYSKF